MSKPTLYGFDGSTYVRSVRMLLAEKGADYEQVPINVLEGEPKEAEHLARHPFGKVPVLDHDGHRILETISIQRYVNDVFDGMNFVPDNPADRARMDTTIAMIDAYGYGALLGGVAAYHLFPDFVGGKDEDARRDGIRQGMLLLEHVMRLRGGDHFIAGAERTLADFHLAPIIAYVAMTDDADQVFSVAGFASWWQHVQSLESFTSTAPG